MTEDRPRPPLIDAALLGDAQGMTPNCPRCLVSMDAKETHAGAAWLCPECGLGKIA